MLLLRVGAARAPYERLNPSGAMTLFVILREAFGPMAALEDSAREEAKNRRVGIFPSILW